MGAPSSRRDAEGFLEELACVCVCVDFGAGVGGGVRQVEEEVGRNSGIALEEAQCWKGTKVCMAQ